MADTYVAFPAPFNLNGKPYWPGRPPQDQVAEPEQYDIPEPYIFTGHGSGGGFHSSYSADFGERFYSCYSQPRASVGQNSWNHPSSAHQPMPPPAPLPSYGHRYDTRPPGSEPEPGLHPNFFSAGYSAGLEPPAMPTAYDHGPNPPGSGDAGLRQNINIGDHIPSHAVLNHTRPKRKKKKKRN